MCVADVKCIMSIVVRLHTESTVFVSFCILQKPKAARNYCVRSDEFCELCTSFACKHLEHCKRNSNVEAKGTASANRGIS